MGAEATPSACWGTCPVGGLPIGALGTLLPGPGSHRSLRPSGASQALEPRGRARPVPSGRGPWLSWLQNPAFGLSEPRLPRPHSGGPLLTRPVGGLENSGVRAPVGALGSPASEGTPGPQGEGEGAWGGCVPTHQGFTRSRTGRGWGTDGERSVMRSWYAVVGLACHRPAVGTLLSQAGPALLGELPADGRAQPSAGTSAAAPVHTGPPDGWMGA